MKTTSEILISARAKIEDPKNWCQGTLARDFTGSSVSETSLTACQWCAIGAIYSQPKHSVEIDHLLRSAQRLLSEAADLVVGTYSVILANDYGGLGQHGIVLSIYDRAISLATSRGGLV
jgi:hypothetical protein